MEDFEIRIPQPGERYEHYRGGTFEVLVVGRLSEERDQIMVVYKSLDRGHVWIRPLGMWSEYVEWWSERSPETKGPELGEKPYVMRREPRFKRV